MRPGGQGKSDFALSEAWGRIEAVRYFDHNATYPVSSAARTAWVDALDRFPANPSSPHRWGARASKAIDDAREQVAALIGFPASELVWTSGATEANNAIIRHLAAATEGPVLVSTTEHPSIQTAAARLLGSRVEPLPATRDGVVDLGWLQDRLQRGPAAAVVLMAANNETGVLQPLGPVSALCADRGVPLASDAVQWVGRLPTAPLKAASMMSASGHKFGAPQGVGLLRTSAGFRPSQLGGPQEEGRRAGTENVPGILAFAAALAATPAARFGTQENPTPSSCSSNELTERLLWRDRFIERLCQAIPGVEILGRNAERLWNTVAVLMPAPRDCRRRWVAKLDRLDFAVSTGSACSSGKEVTSPVLQAMGYRPEESDRMLRFSSGWETRPEDWDALLAALRQAADELV